MADLPAAVLTRSVAAVQLARRHAVQARTDDQEDDMSDFGEYRVTVREPDGRQRRIIIHAHDDNEARDRAEARTGDPATKVERVSR